MIKVANLSVHPTCFKWLFPKEPFEISRFIHGKERIFDADSCGEAISFWVVATDGEFKFYVCKHEWYWAESDCDEYELINEFNIVETIRENLTSEAQKNLRFLV